MQYYNKEEAVRVIENLRKSLAMDREEAMNTLDDDKEAPKEIEKEIPKEDEKPKKNT